MKRSTADHPAPITMTEPTAKQSPGAAGVFQAALEAYLDPQGPVRERDVLKAVAVAVIRAAVAEVLPANDQTDRPFEQIIANEFMALASELERT